MNQNPIAMKPILGLILAIILFAFTSNKAFSQITALGNELEEVMDSVSSSSKTVICFENSTYAVYDNRKFIFSDLSSNLSGQGNITHFSAENTKSNVVVSTASRIDFAENEYTISASDKINLLASAAKQAALRPINGMRKDLENFTIQWFLSAINEKFVR